MEHRTLGDYTIIKPIGQGVLGSVFLAEHRFMRRQYVLKVLPEEISTDRNFIQRFEEEVGMLSSLEHPGIVKVYNISFAHGFYFLVTDCIVDELGETKNLAQYLSGLDKPLEEEEILSILKQIAAPLDYAHTKKIGSRQLVHRNLKLNNILVGHGKEEIEIYLSDFGLSRIIGAGAVLTRTFKNIAEALNIAHLTNPLKTGMDRYPNPPIEQHKLVPLHTSFLQNYAFLAPEQKRLDSTYEVDAKADIYAFGVLAYFLLMNELPEGIFDLPSERSQYAYNWDRLIQGCLQNQPSRRPDSLMEVLASVCNIDKPVRIISGTDNSRQEKEKYNAEVPAESLSFLGMSIPLEDLVEKKIEETLHSDLCLEEAVRVVKSPEENRVQSEMVPVLQTPHLDRPKTDLDPGAIFQISSTVKTYNPEPKDIANVKPILTEMVAIKGGGFFRGSKDGNRDEMPRHQITLASFAIDIHPVTNEQFVRFLEVMGGEKDSQHNDIIRLRDSRIKRSGGKLSIESGYSKHPVVGVTWYGAVAYAKWVGKRLPTEAEWEIAARGHQENSLYPTGDDIEKNQANFFSSDTIAVMSYAPNGYGLYDMPGNVYEWCYDWYGYNYYEVSIQEPENPQGPLQGVYRVLRGGCWKSLKEDLRCSRRHRNNPGTVNSTYGFRCAADVQLS